jgi:hypothetical protein
MMIEVLLSKWFDDGQGDSEFFFLTFELCFFSLVHPMLEFVYIFSKRLKKNHHDQLEPIVTSSKNIDEIKAFSQKQINIIKIHYI